MPTYEYACTKCKKGFELYQSIKDDALTVCPQEQCRMRTWGKGAVKRLLGTGAGLIFKGSGFYITDYRSENYKSGAKKDAAPSGGSGDAPAKSDAKPAADKPAADKPKPKPAAPKADS